MDRSRWVYLEYPKRQPSLYYQISFCENDFTWLQEVWPQTCINLGYPQPKDPRSGSAIGGFNQLTTVDPKLVRRRYVQEMFCTHY